MKVIRTNLPEEEVIALTQENLNHLGIKEGDTINIDRRPDGSISLVKQGATKASTISELFSEFDKQEHMGLSDNKSAIERIKKLMESSTNLT